ncbi:MAG: efflux RND transporter periplasmic adaptor subunit [Planctomycetota bacterium]
MKWVGNLIGLAVFAILCAGAWVMLFHLEWLKPQHKEEAEAEVETEVPVHVGKIKRATLHHYIEAFGLVAAETARDGKPAASARVASPSSGVVAEQLCSEGQRVEKGAPLFQLDGRAARAEEEKAAAALASAQSALVRLKASTRPEQLAVAEVAVEKARHAVTAAEKDFHRQQALSADQVASAKQVEAAELLFRSAGDDQATAEKQLALLQSMPLAEEVAEANAKIAEAEKALAAARLQHALLTIKAPLSATVLKVNVNPGEAVDATTVLAELADLARLEISATVIVPDLQALKPGQPVEVYTGSAPKANETRKAAPGSVVKGTLSFIGFQADPKNDTIAVRVSLPAEAGMRPGQFAHIRIADEEHRDCLVVPLESVFRNQAGGSVIAVVAGEKASLRHVTPGLRENALIEVESREMTEAEKQEAEKQEEQKKEEAKKEQAKKEEEKKEEKIKEGDTVVTEGAYGLPEETKVRVIGE